MATAGIYYIDTFNFADATAVYTDAALTTFAADGFYQMGGVTARQQVSGILKPAEPCPSCVKPSPDPPPNPNNAFKVTDTVTSAVDYVVLSASFSVGQEVTTDISANCWLINELAVNSTTNVITGGCAPIPPPPALYYEVDLCPVSGNSGAPSKIYVDNTLTPTASNKVYYYNIKNAYYRYYNAQPVSTPQGSIPYIATGLALKALVNCPAVVVPYLYWYAQECNNPNITVIIRGPLGTRFTVGQSVNISSTCYEITGERVGSTTTYDKEYLTGETIYTGCTSGASPCIASGPVYTSFLARETTTSVSEYVLFKAGFSINNNVEIQTSGGVQIAGCYKLESQSTQTTSNTIIDDCPPVVSCAIYTVSGSGTWQRCIDGAVQSADFSSSPSEDVCARLGTASFSGGESQSGVCFQDIPINPPGTGFDYFTAQLCDGSGGTISVKTDGERPPVGAAVQINNGSTCYTITSTAGSSLATDVITNTSDNCDQCNPPPSCRQLSVTYHTSTVVCPTSGYTVTFADTTDLATATKLFSSDGCKSSSPANSGTYSNSSISRYWNGSTFTGPTTPCTSGGGPAQITGTITSIDNQIYGSALGVGYTLTGSGKNASTTGTSPLAIGNPPFNTDVSVNPGFSITDKKITYSPTSITQSSSITVTVEGTISVDTPVNVYSVITCGNNIFYTVDSGSQTLSLSSIIRFQPDGGGVALCGKVLSTTSGTKNADFVDFVTSDGCRNNSCVSASFGWGSLF